MVFRIDEKEKRHPKTDIVIHSWPWSGQQKSLVKIQSAQVVNIRSAATVQVYKFRMGPLLCLLAYRVLDANTLKLLMVGPHENFYRDLKPCLEMATIS